MAKKGLYRRGRLSSVHKKFQPKSWPIGLTSRARQNWSKKRKHPHFASPSQANPHPNKKNCFNRTKKTCCIRRGFEQHSSYSGWRVITIKPRDNLLARAVVKGWHAIQTLFKSLETVAFTLSVACFVDHI